MNSNLHEVTIGAVRSLTDWTKLRYLIAGGWNTAFGYGCGLGLYYGLEGHLHVVMVGILANVLAITMAFITYKLFVFRTKGNWLVEYLRAYLVYGATGVISIGLLWLLVDGADLPFWIAQGLAIVITVIASYVFHSRFTFKRTPLKGAAVLPPR